MGDDDYQVKRGTIRHGIESMEDSESSDYRTIDDVAAKETLRENDLELT